MSVRLTVSVDRFEGQRHSVAVLVTDDGESVNMPRSLLPPDIKPGDVLTFAIEHDAEATRRLAEETDRVQRKLSQGDPGGDIRL
jgi:hypothetical protein